MKILSVDSSSVSASVSITENGVTLAENFINNGLTHSQTLMPMVEKTLSDANASIKDIDLFAITNGPGSFTGVRIGIASVKGMADALNKTCFAVSTLEAIAEPLKNEDLIACAVMDARCNQVYTAQFDCKCGLERKTDDDAISIADLTEQLKSIDGIIMLIGDGALLCYNKMKEELPDIEIAPLNIRYQSASSVCLIASEMLEKDEDLSVSPDELIPCYLRLSQAERELKNKNK